ncbi:MAG: hypothetical protein KAW47_08515 [Thermoplasmatales archaeon]|nr:hypothetical protein [Thermoplasmatales archaeon]
MEKDKQELKNSIITSCKNQGWHRILYAGIVGSALATQRKNDIDIVVITDCHPKMPCMFHNGNISLLVLSESWLHYSKHREEPTGLVPSVLFKSIELSQPVIGCKDYVTLPTILACDADWININIKKERYEKIDRKNYLIALLFDRLLQISPDALLYDFDNIRMAKNIGAPDIANALYDIYTKKEIIDI